VLLDALLPEPTDKVDASQTFSGTLASGGTSEDFSAGIAVNSVYLVSIPYLYVM